MHQVYLAGVGVVAGGWQLDWLEGERDSERERERERSVRWARRSPLPPINPEASTHCTLLATRRVALVRAVTPKRNVRGPKHSPFFL